MSTIVLSCSCRIYEPKAFFHNNKKVRPKSLISPCVRRLDVLFSQSSRLLSLVSTPKKSTFQDRRLDPITMSLLMRRAFPLKRSRPKGSFPSLEEAISDSNISIPVLAGMDPSITASTPRKRKKRSWNGSFQNNTSNSSIKKRMLLNGSWVTSTDETSHIASTTPSRKRRRFDWTSSCSKRSKRWSADANNEESDEVPLMGSITESNSEDSWDWGSLSNMECDEPCTSTTSSVE
jgi:hypothetical protein